MAAATKNAGYPDFTKMFSDMKMPQMDFNALFSIQRRNFEAASAASQMLTEGVRAVSRRQAEILQSGTEELLQTAREIWTSTSPEANASKQSDLAKGLMENSMSNVRELTEMATKSSAEAVDVLNKRFMENFEELNKMTGTK